MLDASRPFFLQESLFYMFRAVVSGWIACVLYLSITASLAAETYRIGVALPLSGQNAEQGQAMLNGLKLYINDRKQSTKAIAKPKLELVVKDDQNNPQQAQRIAKELAADKSVLAVIGHQFSSVALAAGEIYQSQGIVNISPSASNPIVTQGRDWVFSMNYQDNRQGEFMAIYLRALLNLENIVIIHTDDAYGKGLANSFSDKAIRIGLQLSQTIRFQQAEKFAEDFIRQQLAIDDAAIDGFVLFTHTDDGTELIKQIRAAGFSVPIMGPDSFSKDIFIQALGEETKNVLVTSPFVYELSSLRAKNFINQYQQQHKESTSKSYVPYSLWSAFCYDALALVAQYIDQPGEEPSRAGIRDYLANIKTVDNARDGISGTLYFDQYGAMQRPVVVSKIERQRFKPAYRQLQEVKEAYALQNLAQKIEQGEVITVAEIPYYQTQVVYAGLDFYRINNIDVSAQRFDVEFYLWFKWQGDLDVDNIDFLNNIFSEENTREILREGYSQRLNYVAYKVKNAFLTPYDLHQFPFDVQYLPMQLAHKNKDAKQLQLVVDSQQLSNAKLKQIYPEEWLYVKRQDFSGTYKAESNFGDPYYSAATGEIDFSVYQSNIVIQRILLPYLLTLFLPLGILIIITLLLFLIPVDQFEARITIVMTALLSVLVFHDAQSDSLPNVGYLIKADIYFIITYVLMFGLIINTVVVNQISRKQGASSATKMNRWFSWVLLPLMILAFVFVTMPSL